MKPILSHHTKVSRQQINSAVGTLFAFLVKALLAVTVSDVFSQLAWNTVTTRTTEIGVDDDLFSILTNGFYILDLPLWRHHPLAMGLALVFWLLPADWSLWGGPVAVVQLPGCQGEYTGFV